VVDVAKEVPIEEGREQVRNTDGNTIAMVSHISSDGLGQSSKLTKAI
jgi:hypothetical protein